MIQLNTIKEALEFIDSFDGYGMISENEDLQISRLLEFPELIDDYTPEERKKYENYLTDIDVDKEIESQLLQKYNVTSLAEIDFFTLKRITEDYDY